MSVIPPAAIWHGPPSKERINQLKTEYFYDAGDPWTGRKIGQTYGCLYRIVGNRLMAVEFGQDGKEAV